MLQRGLAELLLLALLAMPVTAALSRRDGRPAAGTVQRLVLDIDESVRKAGGDAEVVFATLYAYDQQVKESLEREIDGTNDTLMKLTAMRSGYVSRLRESEAQLRSLGVAAEGSARNATADEAGAGNVSKKITNLLSSVKLLVGLLQSAAVTPDGHLATPEAPDASGEPSRVYSFVRRLLAANRAIKPQFPDVFAAWAPPTSLLALRSSKAEPLAARRQQRRLRMTPALLGRTVAALRVVEARLARQRSRSLLQLASRQQDLTEKATSARIQSAERQGLSADLQQEADELSLSIAFTEAVLKMDNDFYLRLQQTIKTKADLVDAARGARTAQLKTLGELIDLLGGKFSMEQGATGAEGEADGGVASFLQVRQSAKSAAATAGPLRLEIESALRTGADTHGILLRIKAMLDQKSPTDGTSAQTVVAKLGGVLRAVAGEQSRAEEAKLRCEVQVRRQGQEEQSLKANLKLMNSAQEHVKSAIAAARDSLRRIDAKTESLKSLVSDFSHTVSQAMKTLAGQSSDRVTIAAAAQKAAQVVSQSSSQSAAAVALLGQMREDLLRQEGLERKYRVEEAAFRSSFVSYVKGYLQLLQDSKGHYTGCVASLQLYETEVSGDAAAQRDVLASGGELAREGQELCSSILRFYDQHSKRQAELTHSLRAMLPRMPELLGSAEQPAADA